MKKYYLIVLVLTSIGYCQVPIFSANPDLLYSTSNEYGPWGSPDYLYSFTNDYGPVASPDSVTGVMNEYGLGLQIDPVVSVPSPLLGDSNVYWYGLLTQPIEPIFEFVEVSFQFLDSN